MEVLVGKISTFYTEDYRGSPVGGGGVMLLSLSRSFLRLPDAL